MKNISDLFINSGEEGKPVDLVRLRGVGFGPKASET
jgi:hypothetical protein